MLIVGRLSDTKVARVNKPIFDDAAAILLIESGEMLIFLIALSTAYDLYSATSSLA